MKFVQMLTKMHKKNAQHLSEVDREILYELLAKMTSSDAMLLYADLTYLYVCAVNDEIPIRKNLQVLHGHFETSFIRSLVDIGTVMDKISDAANLDCESRVKKWTCEKADAQENVRKHQQHSMRDKRWSRFMIESRDENKVAYEEMLRDGGNKRDPFYEFLAASYEELEAKPPIYYQLITTNHLSIQEKRALLHKYGLVYNLLPSHSRDTMQTLAGEIFVHVLANDTNDHVLANDSSTDSIETKRSCCALM